MMMMMMMMMVLVMMMMICRLLRATRTVTATVAQAQVQGARAIPTMEKLTRCAAPCIWLLGKLACGIINMYRKT
eukprot:12429485-Karenia_brevis.AAC.1